VQQQRAGLRPGEQRLEPGSSSTNGPAADCEGRCNAVVDKCRGVAGAGADSSGGSGDLSGGDIGTQAISPSGDCRSMCQSLTEHELTCLETRNCDLDEAQQCASASPSSPTPTSPSSPPGSKPADSSLPSSVTVTGHFGALSPIKQLSSDGKKVSVVLSANAPISISPALPDQLDLQKASSVTVSSPSSSCASKPSYTLTRSAAGFAFSAVDVLPATACASFADAVKSQGLKVVFKDVPVLNTSGKVGTVTLTLSP
jgi:hypothetical protein